MPYRNPAWLPDFEHSLSKLQSDELGKFRRVHYTDKRRESVKHYIREYFLGNPEGLQSSERCAYLDDQPCYAVIEELAGK